MDALPCIDDAASSVREDSNVDALPLGLFQKFFSMVQFLVDCLEETTKSSPPTQCIPSSEQNYLLSLTPSLFVIFY